MGLDMYLSARFHLSNFGEREKPVRDAVLASMGFDDTDKDCLTDDGVTVGVPVMYWRKANAIHKWFVDTCQNGEDDCREAYVSREQLTELLETCLKLKVASGNAEAASELLPTTGGFFFGGTEYDEWYWSDVADTAERLNKILANPKFADADFTYTSSW
jgi:hypothetical protein